MQMYITSMCMNRRVQNVSLKVQHVQIGCQRGELSKAPLTDNRPPFTAIAMTTGAMPRSHLLQVLSQW